MTELVEQTPDHDVLISNSGGYVDDFAWLCAAPAVVGLPFIAYVMIMKLNTK